MIRKFKKQDKEVFLKWTRDFYHSDAVDHDIPEEFHEDAWQEMLRSEEYMTGYLIETEEGEPAGYAIISKTYSHEGGGMVWWIEELYIQPDYRGRGLGKAFFNFIDEVKDSSVTRVRLEVELENEKAIQLYKKFGFEPLQYGQMYWQLREGSR